MPDETTLMQQASDTAHEYLGRAIRSIDHFFGAGYAAAHPELVGQFIRTAAEDFNTMMMVKAIQGAVTQTQNLTFEVEMLNAFVEESADKVVAAIQEAAN